MRFIINEKFVVEAECRDEAFDLFFQRPPNGGTSLGWLVSIRAENEGEDDTVYSLTANELLKRHMIRNRDVYKMFEDKGMEPFDQTLDLMTANAKFAKANPGWFDPPCTGEREDWSV